jgi:hypothetical protein
VSALEIPAWVLFAMATWSVTALIVGLVLGAVVRRRDEQVPDGEGS